jgi:hypothetical protein
VLHPQVKSERYWPTAVNTPELKGDLQLVMEEEKLHDGFSERKIRITDINVHSVQ